MATIEQTSEDPKTENQTDENINSEDSLPHLHPSFDVETLTYYSKQNSPENQNNGNNHQNHYKALDVRIKYATSTRGRNLIHGSTDSTGIMLWPASHLLCQYIAWNASFSKQIKYRKQQSEDEYPLLLGKNVLELGCGCGIVSITAAITHAAEVVFCTDMVVGTLRLARENMILNELCTDEKFVSPDFHYNYNFDPKSESLQSQNKHSSVIIPHCLTWGNETDINDITSFLRSIQTFTEVNTISFDTIMAADIIYPATCGETLNLLFQTVSKLLKVNGRFLLSFVTRDGHRTPLKLIHAATKAGYKFDIISSDTFMPTHSGEDCKPNNKVSLPPLIGAKLLVLTRCNDASFVNGDLGSASCLIFPGLKDQEEQALEVSSEEEWEAPYVDDDLDSD